MQIHLLNVHSTAVKCDHKLFLRHPVVKNCRKLGTSVKWKIISRLRNELGLKDRDEHHLYSDAADRLHLRCCGSQNSTESQRAVLGRERPQKRAPQPEPAPKKLDIIFHLLP